MPKNQKPDDSISFDLQTNCYVSEYAIAQMPELQGFQLSAEQDLFLQAFEQGHTTNKICKELGIPRALVGTWKTDNNLFAECFRLVLRMRAEDMEDQLLAEGASGQLRENPRMFAIKGNLPQYRDNYLPPPSGQSNITIMLNGQELNAVAGLIRSQSQKQSQSQPDRVVGEIEPIPDDEKA